MRPQEKRYASFGSKERFYASFLCDPFTTERQERREYARLACRRACWAGGRANLFECCPTARREPFVRDHSPGGKSQGCFGQRLGSLKVFVSGERRFDGQGGGFTQMSAFGEGWREGDERRALTGRCAEACGQHGGRQASSRSQRSVHHLGLLDQIDSGFVAGIRRERRVIFVDANVPMYLDGASIPTRSGFDAVGGIARLPAIQPPLSSDAAGLRVRRARERAPTAAVPRAGRSARFPVSGRSTHGSRDVRSA